MAAMQLMRLMSLAADQCCINAVRNQFAPALGEDDRQHRE